ncbi:MAG: tyrosine-type recombinase/integrase [Planctomycetota bacterium JB042]
MPRTSVPSYRLHRARGLAVVRLGGRDFYLGPHGSRESREAYERLVAEWIAAGRPRPFVPAAEADPGGVTVAEVTALYLTHAAAYYRKAGDTTSEMHVIRRALSFATRLHGRTPAEEFGAAALKEVRAAMLEPVPAARDDSPPRRLSRTTVNAYVHRIRRMFRWAAEQDLVPGSTWHALRSVAGLRAGRSTAPEPPDVRPVPEEHARAVADAVAPPVAAMIRLQLLTGMRPGEVRTMRARELDTTGDVWTYRPAHHKTEHHGKARVVFLGPEAQRVVRPRLAAVGIAGYLFGVGDGRRPYSGDAYTRAVRRACEALEIEPWTPNQLRHTAATRLRAEFGLEATRAILGHATAATSELYAEVDEETARSIMRDRG